VNHISGQSFFPNTSARNLCEGCWQTWASSHWRWQFIRVTIYVGNECCTNWTSYVYCCLKIEECRHFLYGRTDQTLKIKKFQNKICYITATLNVNLFCSHKDTFCWKIKGIPQHLAAAVAMLNALVDTHTHKEQPEEWNWWWQDDCNYARSKYKYLA
jgi:hypothetical protein